MIFLGTLQMFCILGVLFYEYYRKSVAVFLWATLLVMFGLMHFITVLFNISEYSSKTLTTASAFVILFCLTYITVRVCCFRSWEVSVQHKSFDTYGKDRVFANLLFLVLLFSVIGYALIITSVSGSVVNISKDNVYRAMASKSLMVCIFTYLYFSSAPVTLYFFVTRSYHKIFACLCLIFVRSFISSSRMDMVIIFVACICVIIFHLAKRHELRKIVILGILGLVGIYCIYALRSFRYYYSFNDLDNVSIKVLNEHIIDFIKTDNGELGLRKFFYQFIENNNAYTGFNQGLGYKRVLMLLIPSRFSFGLKPEEFCNIMGRAVRPGFHGIINYTVTPTLFGDCFANFGFWGFIMGAAWGLLVKAIDCIIRKSRFSVRCVLLGLCATIYIDIARGSVYNPLCYLVYCGIVIGLISFMVYRTNFVKVFTRRIKLWRR